MAQIRTTITALIVGLIAAPALAGGIALDVPRFDFPKPDPTTTRACHDLAFPAAPAPCHPAGQ